MECPLPQGSVDLGELLHSRIQIGELDFPHVRQHSQLVEVVSDGFLLPQDFLQSVQNHNAFSETTGGHIVALAHMGLCCFPAYRFQILCCYSDAELFVFFHLSSVSIEVGTGFCPIWGIWRGAGTPATSQMRCWLLPNGRIFPAAAGFLCVLNLRFSALPARRRNVGLCGTPAHTLAVWAKNRTQRRHAPHGAVQALGTPAGSIVPIIFTDGKSALSARLSEIHRLPLLR